MAVYTKTANDVFAPNDAGGTPRGVENGDAQRWGTEVERAISDGGADIDAKVAAERQAREQGLQAEAQAREQADAALSDRIDQIDAGVSVSYETRSQLYADLDHDDGAIGHVFGDSNEAYRGVYKKSGASGSGSWTRIGPLPTVIEMAQSRVLGRPAGAGNGPAQPLLVSQLREIVGNAGSTGVGLVQLANLSKILSGTGEPYEVVRSAFVLEIVQKLNDAHALELASPHPVEVTGNIYPLVLNDEGRVLLGIDKTTGNVIGGGLGGYGNGNGDAGEAEAPLLPYLDGDILHAVGADDIIVADLSDYDVKHIGGGNGGHVSVALDRPLLGATSVVGAGPARPNLLIPSVSKLLYVFIGIGQSLMVGSTAAGTLVSIVPVLPDDVLMFNAGANSDVRMGLPTSGGDNAVLDPATLTGFLPLAAKVGQGGGARGETAMEAFATNLSLLSREIDVKFRSLSFTAAQGGTVYADLKKGTQIYANMLTALTKAKALAAAQGWQLVVAGVLHKHGEGDGNNASYLDFLMEWQGDIDADVKAITGQALDVHFFMGQPSTFGNDLPQAVQAMVDAHNTSPVHWLAGPDYPFGEFYSDETHFHGPGYFMIGEQMALAYRDVMWGRGYKITQMTAAQRSGSTVTLTWDVPAPPLVFDTTTISERDVKGLRYTDSNGAVAITDAVISNDGTGTGVGTITLTLGSTPSGSGETVHYAMSRKITDPALNRVRGNIRDSRADVSRYDGRPLHGWAPSHRIAVEI